MSFDFFLLWGFLGDIQLLLMPVNVEENPLGLSEQCFSLKSKARFSDSLIEQYFYTNILDNVS